MADRAQIKSALSTAMSAVFTAQLGLRSAPYQEAAPAMKELDSLVDSLAAELGVGAFVGACEYCESLILDDENYSSGDGYLCDDCIKQAQAGSGAH